MNREQWEEIAASKIRNKARILLDPYMFSTFENVFRALRTQRRVDLFGIMRWKQLVILLLKVIISADLGLTHEFFHYLIWNCSPITFEIILLNRASELLDRVHYAEVLFLMGDFINSMFHRPKMSYFWLALLNKVWRRPEVTHWLRPLAQNLFRGISDQLEFLIDLRPFLDNRSFNGFIRRINEYHFRSKELNYVAKVEVLKNIVADYFPDNETLLTKFLLSQTGGWVSFAPPRSHVLSTQPARQPWRSNVSTPLARHHQRLRAAESKSVWRQRAKRLARARVALNFDAGDERQNEEQKHGEMKGQQKNDGQPSGIVKAEERRSKGVKEEGEKSDGEETTNEEGRSETEKVKRKKEKRESGRIEMMEHTRQFETEKEVGQKRKDKRKRRTSETQKRRLDCEKVEEKEGERKRRTSERLKQKKATGL